MEILLYLSFLTGFVSILTPCILPVLPIFLGFNLNSRNNIEILSFSFALISIFLLVILFTALFTTITYSYINYVRIIASLILLILGIILLFNYSFNFGSFSFKRDVGIKGSFLLGILTSIAWAPCYGPYLISLIGILVTFNDVIYSMINLVLYCLGFLAALLVVGVLISKISINTLIYKIKYMHKLFALLIIVSSIYLLLTSLGVIL